jgi:hypothetical protein
VLFAYAWNTRDELKRPKSGRISLPDCCNGFAALVSNPAAQLVSLVGLPLGLNAYGGLLAGWSDATPRVTVPDLGDH